MPRTKGPANRCCVGKAPQLSLSVRRSDFDDEPEPKRQRIGEDSDSDGADGAPAAASSSSSSAASAAAPSSAAAAAAVRDDAAVAAAAAAVPLPDEPECPVCMHAYECEEAKEPTADRIPRTLPCTHSACSGCLLKIITANPGRIKCPTCSDDRLVQLPKGMAEAAVSTPAAWLRCIPQSADIIQSIRRSQHLSLALQQREQQMRALPSMRCSEFECASSALHWCVECDLELCAEHDASTHARHLSGHKRELIADRQARKRAQLEQARATAGAQLKLDVSSATDRLKDAIESQKAKRQSLARELAQIHATIAGQEAQLAELNAAADRLAPLMDVDAQKHETSVGAVLSGAAAAAAVPASAHAASAVSAVAPSRLIAMPLRRPVPYLSLLGDLKEAHLADLLGYLRIAGVSMDHRGLLYRGSRDGFRQEDFLSKCAGHSATLTLVKESGFIFGAYIHCAWPAVHGTVADPTGKSFLFSLVNASDKTVRFSLQDKDRAIHVANSVAFGSDKYEGGKVVGHSNIVLMRLGRSADQKDSNSVNPLKTSSSCGAYQPAADAAYAPHEYGLHFFAGQQRFTVAEIEVYWL